MPEAVRLVIWDLDDTFWNGTLAEGPVSHLAETQTVVRELAHRGIISSICSKNDLGRVKSALVSEGLWEFFVFPSVNWDPKGPRVRALIELSQLRPETVLFVDDNPSNLEEAKHFSPGIQTGGVDIISGMLDNPLFVGRPDPQLERLQQYKALEQRRADERNASEGVEQFLRESQIQVETSYDLDDKLDRVIELINRTNQLNFTKRRLPEDPAAARAQLSQLLHSHEIQAGLLRVVDRYGDHGYAGFYMIRNGSELLYFCFSCRILGMGIESWLYRRLGRPRLAVVGEVLSNPVADTRSIDWIKLTDSISAGDESGSSARAFDWFAARGGCDLQALSHYFKLGCPDVIGEFNVGRGGFDARVDHSIFLRYALGGLGSEAMLEATKLGYRPEDFRTAVAKQRVGSGLIVLSFWSDVSYALYRHRRLSFDIPFALSGQSNHVLDARRVSVEELPQNLRGGWMAEALRRLQTDYDYVGMINEESFKANLRIILSALPTDVPVVLLKANTTLRDREHGVTHTSSDNIKFNRWIADVADGYPTAHVVSIRDVISTEDEVSDWSHFDRIVYYRLYQRICEVIIGPSPDSD
jgi:FkbH-like protein